MSDSIGTHSRASSRIQTGSVIEFMFLNRGYLAASYPYPPKKERLVKRTVAKEGLPNDIEKFLREREKNPVYIINASANASGCWIIVYWAVRGEYGVHIGGRTNQHPEIVKRLHDFQNKNRGIIRSTAFGCGEETIFLRASSPEHHWSFRWNDLPAECEMTIQDSMEQSGWKDPRFERDGKKIERIEYYGTDPVEEGDSKNISAEQTIDPYKRAPGCIRFLTLGNDNTWIIYGETWHTWDKREKKLPSLLLKGLEMGEEHQWIINKVELSLFNKDEFVLIYDNGYVFYYIESPTFVDKFKMVVQEWAASKEVEVFYNEDVVPERIESDHNVQNFVTPSEGYEPTASDRMQHSSTDDVTLEDNVRPPKPFAVTGGESANRHHGPDSTIPWASTRQGNRPSPMPSEPVMGTARQGGQRGDNRNSQLNTTPSPATSHKRMGSGNSVDAAHDQGHAPIAREPIVRTTREGEQRGDNRTGLQSSTTSPAPNHRRLGSDDSEDAAQDQRHKSGFKGAVRSLRKKLNSDKG